MVTTNLVKWQDDGDDELTAYCSDDDTDTEVGPAKWDDTNNRLEINCNSVDATVKWDDGGNNLESRTTDDGCYECESGCEICEIPNEVDVTFIDVQQCPESEEPNLNGTWRLVLTDIEEDICRWRYTSGDVMITFYVTATTSGLTAITKTDYPSTVCFFDAPSLVCQFSFVNDYQTDNYCWYGGAGAQSCYGGTAEISW